MSTAVKSKVISESPNTIESPKKPARKTYLEVMRVIAAFFVIVNHTNSDVFLKMSAPPSFTWYFSLAYFYLSKIAVPLFFMIMGGLLLQKVDPVKKSLQRIGRALLVTVIYSGVYYYYFHSEYYYRKTPQSPPEMSVKEFLEMIFTNRATNAFWYLYAYIGLLILLPVLQRFAQGLSKGSHLYFIILSVGVLGSLPLITLFHEYKLNAYITDTFIPVHIGLLFVGLFIEKHMKIDFLGFVTATMGFLFTIFYQIFQTKQFYDINQNAYLQLDNWSYITVTLSAFCFYIMIKYLSNYVNLGEKVSKVVCYLGSLTFGIYLLSDLAKYLTKDLYFNKLLTMDIIPATIIWELIIFAGCAVVTAVLKLIPGFKKLI